MRKTPFAEPSARSRAGTFGMSLFLISLGILFTAGLIGYFAVWWRNRPWPEDLPPLPGALWISTAILIVSSVTMQSALTAARKNQQGLLRLMLLATLYCGIAFLLIQFRAWLSWLGPVAQRWSDSEDYRYALAGFYVLTGLHAAHVVGGLVPMCIITRHAFAGEYSPQEHSGVQYVSMYWHFLDVVWLILFASLKLTVG